jgi:competence protein ComEA
MKRFLNRLILVAGGIWIGGLIWLVSIPPRGEPVSLRPAPTPGLIHVHVAGAVEAPGVYELPRGSRVIDAIEAAGGLLSDSAPAAINLAEVLEDGVRIDVNEAPAPGLETSEQTGADPSVALNARIDINTANRAQLESLPGIGPTIAGRIIDYRETNGPFEKTADIVRVSGIGPETFDTIKDLITVND